MKSNDVLVDFLEFKIYIRKIPKQDCHYLLDQIKSMTYSERDLFVVTYCIKDIGDVLLLLDKTGTTKKYRPPRLTRLLYEGCLKVNPKIRLPHNCPNCGSSKVQSVGIMTQRGGLFGKQRVYCKNCALFVFQHGKLPVSSACDTKVDSIIAWNNFCSWLEEIPNYEKKSLLSQVMAGVRRIDYRNFVTVKREKTKDMGDFHIDEREEKMKQFWMVVCFEHTHLFGENWSVSQHGTRVRHESKESAEEEAEKLSKGQTSKHFVVLEAIESYTVPPQKSVKTILGDWTEEG